MSALRVDTRQNEDVDERFRALLEGLRTSLPGVQVLFAFLLTAPLTTSFADLGTSSRTAFAIAFYSSGMASALLIAPSVHQRLRAPASGIRRQSRRHLNITIWVTIIGTFAMGIAIIATVYLVSSIVFDALPATIATSVLGAVVTGSWFYLPFVTFRDDEKDPAVTGASAR